MKKKLVISIYDSLKNPYYGGGGARVVHELTKRLRSSYEIIVLTGKYPGYMDSVESGVAYKHIGTLRFGPKLNQFFFHFYLMYYVLTLEFDMWVESFTPPFSTSFLQLFTRKPVVALVQMLSGEDMMRKYRIPFHLVERIGLKTYKYFSIPSPALFETLRKYNKTAKIELISNGIDLPPVTDGNSPDEKYILYLGRIEINQKGLDLLIDAYSRFAPVTAYRLYIAGNGNSEDEEALKELIRKNNLQDKVVLKGRVDGKAKEDLYRHATLFVMPSRFETFGIVALEALSYGKPVVYFALDTLSWIPENVGRGVIPFCPKTYAKTIEEILSDTALHHRMSEDALQYSKAYSWDMIVSQYENYFSSISSAR